RSLLRNTLMHILHTLLRFLGVSHIRDTQCGFKLFTRSAAHTLFQTLHIPHWIFDVELLVVALMCGMKTEEISVGWEEVAGEYSPHRHSARIDGTTGSKINIIWDSAEMLRDLLVLRANYAFGRWKIAHIEAPADINETTVGNGHVTPPQKVLDNSKPRRRVTRID
ncbi:dolichyl-phosphate beta-glucosyltransferase, partial [Ceratobasidium sp. 394]